jgi:hypothetical protein
LPILEELEAQLELELRALAQPPAPQVAKLAAPRPARVARRALLLVALVSLVGASALAGRSVFAGSRKPSSGLALLAAGGHGPDSWQLQAYLHEGSVCYALFVAGSASSACGAPAAAGVRAQSALSPDRRFVAGLAGADVTKVQVRVAGRTMLVSTEPVVSAPGAARAKLPSGVRWFVTSLAGGAARQAPAWIAPRDRAGRAVGASVLDCSLGGSNVLCQRTAGELSGGAGEASG